jgi:hypothetical protein
MPIGKVPLSKKELEQLAVQKEIDNFIKQIDTKFNKLTTQAKKAVMLTEKDALNRKSSAFGFMRK